MSTISIRQRIEEEIRQRLPAALLEAGVEYHCRRGIREDCLCPYCYVKKSNRHWGFRFYAGEDSSTRKYVFDTYVRPRFRKELEEKKKLL